MKDLSVIALAGRAVVESVERLGYDVTIMMVSPSEYAGTDIIDIGSDVDPVTVQVFEGSVELFRYHGTGAVPLGRYRLYREDEQYYIQLYKTVDTEFQVIYSTTKQTETTLFELRGRGFQYASIAKVGSEQVELEVKSDTLAKIRVPTRIASSVVVDNVDLLVSLDSAPTGITDVLFDLSTRNRVARGQQVLTQRFITLLLSPEVGNLEGLLPKGLPASPAARTIVLSRVTAAVNAVRNWIFKNTSPEADPEERLVQAFVESVNVDSGTGTIDVAIRLRTAAGTTVRAPLNLRG